MALGRSPRSRPRRMLLASVGALIALGMAGCAEPALPETNEVEGAEQPVEARAPDPARETLLSQLQELRGSVVVVRDELAEALEAPTAGEARRTGDQVVALMLDAPELAGGDAGTAPLFPGTTTERGSIAGDDALTATLTAARDSSGALARSTLELLRDPLAGDLGSWQQDPAGVVATVRAAIASPGDLTTLEQQVWELAGEGTRALAWALLVADARDAEDASAYAERGIAHLDLVIAALDDLLDRSAATREPGEGPDGADAEEEGA